MSLSGAEYVWVRGLMTAYYARNSVSLPYEASRREFGYGNKSKIDTRHVSFDSVSEFNQFLRNNTPLYVSASSAEYVNPGAQPMERKGLLGSDLIFEFDADDVQTDCKLVHDSWSCPSCNASGKGRLLKCTSCGKGTKVDEWVCEKCLEETKILTLKLLRILQSDFGFMEENLFINFSGSKGYHIHVRQKDIFSLPKSARVEFMDYLTLHEFDAPLQGFVFDGKQYHCPRFARAKGNVQRLLAEILRLIESGSETDWMLLSTENPRTLKSWLQNREQLFKEFHAGTLPALPGKKTEPFWNNVIASLVEKQRLPIDRQTSGDIFKLVRVPDTLHGSTGLLAKSLTSTQLRDFLPLRDAAVFPPEVKRKVFVTHAPTVSIGKETLDAVEQKEVELSSPLAAYLVGWGAARLA